MLLQRKTPSKSKNYLTLYINSIVWLIAMCINSVQNKGFCSYLLFILFLSIREQHTLLIIDKAKGVCRSSAFAKAFETYSRNDPSRVKVMILKQIFKAVGEWNELELEGLERQLNVSTPTIFESNMYSEAPQH